MDLSDDDEDEEEEDDEDLSDEEIERRRKMLRQKVLNQKVQQVLELTLFIFLNNYMKRPILMHVLCL